MSNVDNSMPHPPGPDAMLAIYLIDMRAQIEAQLRGLTDAQRQIERYRVLSGSGRAQTKKLIARHFQQLISTNRAVAEALADAATMLSELADA